MAEVDSHPGLQALASLEMCQCLGASFRDTEKGTEGCKLSVDVFSGISQSCIRSDPVSAYRSGNRLSAGEGAPNLSNLASGVM